MEFRILGSLDAVSGGRRLRLGGSCEQRLLAALLLDADRVVPVARLAESIWDDPPATAAKQVRNRVSRLRRMLAAAEPGDFIVTDADGYRIAAEAIELDARRFQAGVTRSHQAASAGRTDEAAEWLRSALALWRGPALSGLGGRSLQAVAAAWDERRCAAMETYYGYQLQMGRHRQILGEMAASATAYPFREKLAGQYMLALYRCGLRADALAAYRATRALLAEEMGLDPGPELRQLHQQMLRDDPALALARQGRVLPRDVPVVPRQLPAFSSHFAGRSAELSTLTALLERGSGGAGAVISVIEGMAGIGKTALAVHWAHQAAGQFPDGQLHLNLRGFDASAAPVTPAQAVRMLLDSLAVLPEQIPASLDAQAALYRSLLAGRRVLVVLDNARDADQVRPLLPGSPGCMTVVTSRNHLSGLIIAEGADPLVLGPLSNTDARQLMAARIGQDRVAAEHPAADAIITLCRRLPLALSVVAARAAAHPGFSLDALARELRDSSHAGLDALDDSNTTVSVRAAFSWSCQQLSTAAARLFRLLGLHPGPDITAAAAASLAGLPSAQARRLLAELACSHLITEHQPGRFTIHELLRAYAAEQAHRHDNHAEQRAAVQRMLDHYLHTTYAANQLINPHPVYEAISPGPPSAGTTPESLADDAAANAWLGAEYPVLLAVTGQAAATGWHAFAWQLPACLNEYCRRRGRWLEWVSIQRKALSSARHLGSRLGQACAHAGIARAQGWLGHHEDARAHLNQALALYHELDDQLGQASIHIDLGWILEQQDRPAEALGHDQQTLAIYRAAGHTSGLATTLNNMGWSYAKLGDYRQALACCEEALALQHQLSDRRGQAHTLHSLGYAYHRLGHHQQAAACFEQALALQRELGSRYYQARVLDHLGDAQAAAGDLAGAHASWTEALHVFTQLAHPGTSQIHAKIQQLAIHPHESPAGS